MVGATAGGLVGSFAGSAITESYSTCSVSGTTTAGGFAGTAGGSITNCYCTGLVTGTTEGAFVGSMTGTASGCRYYEIVNERTDARTGHACLKAVGNQDRDGIRITPLDNDMSAYEGFVSTESAWDPASPYDVNLRIYYKNKFPLQTGEDRVCPYPLRRLARTGDLRHQQLTVSKTQQCTGFRSGAGALAQNNYKMKTKLLRRGAACAKITMAYCDCRIS